ncbi:MAG: MFS transporter [Deltaproteobacteria bacterium]|jgi:MFS family permease|nr:MFS transporter [Deltaproteobacteria bacterium]
MVFESSANEETTYVPRNENVLWSRLFVTLLFVNFTNFMGFFMLLPTLSLYLTAEGCPETEIGLVIGSFTVFSIVFRLLSTKVAKRFGAVRAVRFGLLTSAVGTLFFFLIHSTGSYVAARLLQGAGFGVTSTMIVTIASEIIPPSRMAEGLGYLGLGSTAAMALGPLVGIFAAEKAGFGFMFSAVSFFGLTAAAITLTIPGIKVFFPVPATPKTERFRLDRRPFPAAALAVFYGIAISSVSAFLAVYAENAKLPGAAAFFLVSTTGTLVARLLTGKIYDRKGDRAVIPPATLLLFVSFALLLGARPVHPFAYYAAAVIYGFAIGSLFPSIQSLAIGSVPHSGRSVSVTTFFVCYDFGTGSGAMILGFLAGWFGGYRVVFFGAEVCVALIVLTYGFFYLLPGQRKIRLSLAAKEE